MINNTAVFVLSHQRANKITTDMVLRKCGYTGKIYILVDDTDTQLNDYKEIFGDDCIVFSKMEQLKTTDSCDNFGNLKTPLYARNYCFELAKQLNLDYFIMADDDITDLKYAYVNNKGDFIRSKITNIDGVINSLVTFINASSNISSCSFAFSGEYFGGKNGKYREGLGRTIQQFILFKADSPARFLSSKNEDLNISIANFDKLFFEVFDLCVVSPQRMTNEGGISYSSMYENNMYSLMLMPSAIKLFTTGKMRKQNNNIYPKILSGRYKK